MPKKTCKEEHGPALNRMTYVFYPILAIIAMYDNMKEIVRKLWTNWNQNDAINSGVI